MSHVDFSSIAGWDRLRERFPWPSERPACLPIHWAMDYGGRKLVTDAIVSRGIKVVLEIGVFMGGSLRKWLNASPDVVVVAVDPWHIEENNEFVKRHPIGKAHREQIFRQPDGLYESFLSSMWDVRERVIPVRGRAQDTLPILHELGFRPELIFLDTDKSGDEIPLCDQLFPQALLSGDDWLWRNDEGFPIRQPVRDSSRIRKRHLKQAAQTWLIDDHPTTLGERALWVRSLPWEFAVRIHGYFQIFRGRDSSSMPLDKK